jgi:citrate lyase beta subunit
MTDPRLADLLAFLDAKVNHLMFSLYRTRQALTDMQQRIRTDAATLGRVGEALAAVSESERVLAEIQQRLEAVRRDN